MKNTYTKTHHNLLSVFLLLFCVFVYVIDLHLLIISYILYGGSVELVIRNSNSLGLWYTGLILLFVLIYYMSRGFVKRAYNTKKIKIGLGYRVWLMISIIFIGASFTGYITVNQDTLFYSDLISPTKKVVLHDISKVDFIGRIQMITISSRRSAPRQYCELSFTIDIHKNNSVEMYSAQPGPAKRYTVYRLFNILKNKNVPVEAFVDTDGGGCNQDDISKFTQEMKSQMGL